MFKGEKRIPKEIEKNYIYKKIKEENTTADGGLSCAERLREPS